MKRTPQPSIETLEPRIAPATIINPYTVTFQDTDGDTAIIHISAPLFKNPTAAGKILTFTTNDGSTETFGGNNVGESLSEINVTGMAAASGMNISVKTIPQVGVGSNQVNVGSIVAGVISNFQAIHDISLGHITIQGNLGSIIAGSGISTPAIASLTVDSMSSTTESFVLGPINNFHVSGDMTAFVDLIGFQFGNIGHLYIGGSLTGDSSGDSATGIIEFSGHIGSATIGNITGTAGANTGELLGSSLFPETFISKLNVLGSISGGSGDQSGRISAQSGIGKLIVGGSINGGSGSDSGEIAAPLKNVNISGGLTGGSGTNSGTLLSASFSSAGSLIPEAIGTITIGGDVTGGTAGTAASGSTSASVGDTGIIFGSSAKSIVIAGSLIGGTAATGANAASQTADTSGDILVNSITALTIGNNITGGSGPHSGIVSGTALASGGADTLSFMNYGSIVVYGDVTGGSGNASGSILVDSALIGTIKSLHVNGNLTGGSGTQSGELEGSTGLNSFVIGGNVTGGSANSTGEILTNAKITSGVIRGNLTGDASINSSSQVNGSGYIQGGQIGSLSINGNVTSGSNSGGQIANSGAIRSTAAITALTIGGEVTGNSSNPVIISATDGLTKGSLSTTDLAIQKITVGGAATYLDILAGYSPAVNNTSGISLGTPVDGSAQIGTVSFASTLSASNIVAGAEPDPTTGDFGTATNTSIPGKTGDLHSSIASIIVAGAATGDSTPTDSFGFVAENLGSVEVNSVFLPTNLTPGAPESVNGTNLYLLEVS